MDQQQYNLTASQRKIWLNKKEANFKISNI